MDKDEAIRILKGPYSQEIRKIAFSYTSVIFWGRFSEDGAEQEIHNGSIFFLDCGAGPFAVTANHVYEKYLLQKQADPELICQIGNGEFVPESRLIDRDQALDVATFRITEEEVRRGGKIVHGTRMSEWPPRPPQVGKGVFFTGFPKVYWMRKGPNRFGWGSYSAITEATSVSGEKIACQFHREEMVDAFGNGLPPLGEFLGGMSGAPLWTLVQTGIFSWRLAGVIYEFNETLEVLFARRADCIRPDGKLTRP